MITSDCKPGTVLTLSEEGIKCLGMMRLVGVFVAYKDGLALVKEDSGISEYHPDFLEVI